MPIEFKRLKSGAIGLILAALLAAQGVFIAAVFALARSSRQQQERLMPSRDQMDVWLPSSNKAIVRPRTVRASEAKLRSDRPVVGVEVGGKARAYAIDAMSDRTGHLVNDMVGGVPVSVVYCDLTQCLRIYTDPVRSAPLDVEVRGMLNGEMVVEIAGARYLQDSGRPLNPESNARPIPYRTLNPIVTTWKAWMKSHPDTDVFVGDSGSSNPGAAGKRPGGTR